MSGLSEDPQLEVELRKGDKGEAKKEEHHR